MDLNINRDFATVQHQSDDYIIGKNTGARKYTTKTSIVGKFSSVNASLQAVKSHFPYPAGEAASIRIGGGGFNTFRTYEDTLTTFLDNPQSLVEKDKIVRQTIIEQNTPGNTVEYDYQGDYLDIGKFLEGEPECFGNSSWGKTTVRFLKINIAAGINGWVTASDCLHRAKKITNLVDWLEANNVRVAIDVWDISECELYQIKVKDFNNPLQLPDLAIVSHPEFLRRILFRYNEHSDTHQAGYGTTDRLNPFISNLYNEMEGGTALAVGHEWDSKQNIDDNFEAFEAGIRDRVMNNEDLEGQFTILM